MNFDLTPLRPALDDWLSDALACTPPFALTPLVGANSTALYRVTTPASERSVLRLLTNRAWLEAEPDLAEHEAAALRHAAKHGLPAPRLLAFTAQDSPFGIPALLMEHLPGAVDLNPPDGNRWLGILAHELARVHATPTEGFPWHYHSWNEIEAEQRPAWLAPHEWRELLSLGESPPIEPDVFLHRDYHPANLLWQGDALTGIVDWVNGCCGPRAVDVAHCRLNLALIYGLPTAEAFLQAYAVEAGGYDHHPHWDVDCALSWLPGAEFYEPWADFGLPRLSPEEMQSRMRAFLLAALHRA